MPNHTLNFPWLVATPKMCSHAHTHTRVPTQTHTHNSYLETKKEIERSLDTPSPNGGRDQGNLQEEKKPRFLVLHYLKSPPVSTHHSINCTNIWYFKTKNFFILFLRAKMVLNIKWPINHWSIQRISFIHMKMLQDFLWGYVRKWVTGNRMASFGRSNICLKITFETPSYVFLLICGSS